MLYTITNLYSLLSLRWCMRKRQYLFTSVSCYVVKVLKSQTVADFSLSYNFGTRMALKGTLFNNLIPILGELVKWSRLSLFSIVGEAVAPTGDWQDESQQAKEINWPSRVLFGGERIIKSYDISFMPELFTNRCFCVNNEDRQLCSLRVTNSHSQ